MYTFDYGEFYDYYTNPANLISGKGGVDCVSLHYFNNDTDNKKSKQTSQKCDYIIIRGVKIYVCPIITSSTDKNTGITETVYGLMFSVPTIMNGVAFDFHYYLGKRRHKECKTIKDKYYWKGQEPIEKKPLSKNKTKKIRKKLSITIDTDLPVFNPNIDLLTVKSDDEIIFFHKTIQHHTGTNSDNIPEGYREHQNCYFRDNSKIKDINNVVCLDIDKYIMGNRFPNYDKDIIREIMERPFMKNLGGKTRKRKYNKRKKCL